ncbi:MAG TPA: hypothetical protein VG734_25700 [Lacunisphaera sp.]|nr:hypothetical protein [Lacunisphaera sp.]
MATVAAIAAHLNDNYTADTSLAVIAQQALAAVEAAGQSGGAQEIERLARDGWPTGRELDLGRVEPQDESVLREAIRFAAQAEVAS